MMMETPTDYEFWSPPPPLYASILMYSPQISPQYNRGIMMVEEEENLRIHHVHPAKKVNGQDFFSLFSEGNHS